MLQMVQLFKCEEDASQAVEWLSELLDALLKTHIRLGDDAQETKVLLENTENLWMLHRALTTMADSCCRPQLCCASLCAVLPDPQGTRFLD